MILYIWYIYCSVVGVLLGYIIYNYWNVIKWVLTLIFPSILAYVFFGQVGGGIVMAGWFIMGAMLYTDSKDKKDTNELSPDIQ